MKAFVLHKCAFQGCKNMFNTQKVRLKKKNICLVQKIEGAFKGLKGLKMTKIHL